MTKKRIIISIIIITIVIAIAITFAFWKLSPEQQEKSRILRGTKIMGKMWKSALNSEKNSNFSISGKIVYSKGSDPI